MTIHAEPGAQGPTPGWRRGEIVLLAAALGLLLWLIGGFLLISTQLLMGALFGAPGLILAAPLAAAGMVAVNMLYVEDVLGERSAAL